MGREAELDTAKKTSALLQLQVRAGGGAGRAAGPSLLRRAAQIRAARARLSACGAAACPQVRDLQRQAGGLTGERDAAAAARDEARAGVAKLQAELQRLRLESAQRDRERAVAEGSTREGAAAERAKLQVGGGRGGQGGRARQEGRGGRRTKLPAGSQKAAADPTPTPRRPSGPAGRGGA